MQRVLVLAALAAVVSAESVPAAGKQITIRSCLVTQAEFRAYVRTVYRRDVISKKAHRGITRRKACAASVKARANMSRFQRREGVKRRERILIDKLTPYGDWAIPAYIVKCESNFNMRALNPSSGAGGWYQLLPSTSLAYGGTSTPHLMSAIQQHRVAGRVLRGQGLSAWVCA